MQFGAVPLFENVSAKFGNGNRYGLIGANAGLVHGDLSEFNVLVDGYGPVIIDLSQAVDAAANTLKRFGRCTKTENYILRSS